MPGRLRSSFRSGNLAEHLGLLLLKGVAAVAEVPRQEDVGLDAVATLLRRDDDGNCYAEDSFVVQLKSASASRIRYTGHELDWLLNQNLPVFVGRVSLKKSSIELYSTIYLHQAVLSLPSRDVDIRFGTSGIASPWDSNKTLPWRGIGDGVKVWRGEPVLRWKLSDLTDKSWLDSAYAMMKRFLQIVSLERELVSLGLVSAMNWTTNEPDSIVTEFVMAKVAPHQFAALADRASPYLRSLFLADFTHDHQPGPTATAIHQLVIEFRNRGADIDPTGFMATIYKGSVSRQQKDSPLSPPDER